VESVEGLPEGLHHLRAIAALAGATVL
jgi:hypothetical protein